jgi:hypothetical protein
MRRGHGQQAHESRPLARREIARRNLLPPAGELRHCRCIQHMQDRAVGIVAIEHIGGRTARRAREQRRHIDTGVRPASVRRPGRREIMRPLALDLLPEFAPEGIGLHFHRGPEQVQCRITRCRSNLQRSKIALLRAHRPSGKQGKSHSDRQY